MHDHPSIFRHNNFAFWCLVTLAVFVLVAAFADVLAPVDPLKTSPAALVSPSFAHPFGTDDLGRDVLSGVIHGARTSIGIGFIVAVLSGFVGVIVGLVAGYTGGWLDDVLMRVTELFLIPPRFFLALVIVAIFGASFTNIIIVLSLTFWATSARVIRAETLAVKERGFILAAQALGSSSTRILWREILPNVLPIVITQTVLRVGHVIFTEAALEFLGLGDANRMSWGYMLHNGQHFMRDAWWIAFFPIAAITLLLISINVVGEALNDALNPKL